MEVSQLDERDHAMVAALLYQQIRKLQPLTRPEDVVPFNAYRTLSARLAGLFEDDARMGTTAFDPIRFISYAMTGRPAS